MPREVEAMMQESEAKSSIAAFREMYTPPGGQPLTDEDINRYTESQQAFIQQIPSLIQREVSHPDAHMRKQAIALGEHAKDLPWNEVIDKGLLESDPEIRRLSVKMIGQLPQTEQTAMREKLPSYIRTWLTEPIQAARMKGILAIAEAPVTERAGLITLGLKDPTNEVRNEAVSLFVTLPDDQRLAFIQDGFKSPDPGVRSMCLSVLQSIPASERTPLLKLGLADADVGIRFESAQNINIVPADDRAELIAMAEQDKQETVRNEAAGQKVPAAFTPATPSPERREELEKIATETPLYKSAEEPFFRKAFRKTGSDTTLLGNVPGQEGPSLKNRAIIRHVEASPYFAWKEAFEAAEFWKSHGFDYVPVEPIIRLGQEQESLTRVDVFTRVIAGPAIKQWEKAAGPNLAYIVDQKKRIAQGLKELGIDHGHMHFGNFVIWFPRTEDGKVDFEKEPRVYVIDFDQARTAG